MAIKCFQVKRKFPIRLPRSNRNSTRLEKIKNDLEIEKLRLEVRHLNKSWWKNSSVYSGMAAIIGISVAVFYGVKTDYFNQLTIQKETLNAKNVQLDSNVNKLMRDTATLNLNILSTTMELEHLKNSIQELGQKLTNKNEKLSQLNGSIKSKNQELASLSNKVVKQNKEYEKLNKTNERNQFDRQTLDYYLKEIGDLNRPANEALKYLKDLQNKDSIYLKSDKFRQSLFTWVKDMKETDQSGDFSAKTNDFRYMRGRVNKDQLIKLENDLTAYIILKTEEINTKIDNLSSEKKGSNTDNY